MSVKRLGAQKLSGMGNGRAARAEKGRSPGRPGPGENEPTKGAIPGTRASGADVNGRSNQTRRGRREVGLKVTRLKASVAAAGADADSLSERLRKLELRAIQKEAMAELESRARAEADTEVRELRERMDEFETISPDELPALVARRRASDGFRRLIFETVPAGAPVIVISGGEDGWLALRSRRSAHFPQGPDGAYQVTPPASSLAAIAHLETLRYGFDEPLYLGIPAVQMWWLDAYEHFARHLDRYYVALRRSEGGVVYDLRASSSRSITWQAQLEDALDRFAACFDREAAVLDWNSGLRIASHFPEAAIFSPPDPSATTLPYLDGSVDLVVTGPVANSASEARRVAAKAVIHRDGERLQIDWMVRANGTLPSTSIVIPSYNGIRFTEPCVRSLIETVPTWIDGEFVVVDDCSTDDTQERLAKLAAVEPRLRVLRNDVNSGFLMTCNRGARESRGEIVLWLNNDTLAMPGWLPPILRTFRQHADAAAVGGKLIFPDGRLQEAGGVVFSDGRSANFGKWHSDPADPLFDYVREVDYVSGAHLAFRRSVLDRLGGFDDRYRPIYCEDTDICFRVRELGMKVYYQPESAIVHIEGGSSGTDESKGDKRYQVANRETFVARWSDALRAQPAYPNRFDLSTLHRLAVRVGR